MHAIVYRCRVENKRDRRTMLQTWQLRRSCVKINLDLSEIQDGLGIEVAKLETKVQRRNLSLTYIKVVLASCLPAKSHCK